MLRPLQVDGCGFAKQRGHGKRQAGGQLLHRAANNRMRLGLMPALQNGTQAPAAAAKFDQQKAAQQGPPKPSLMISGATSSVVPARPTSMAKMVGPCKRSPPGIEASIPIIQNGESVMKTRCQAAGHPLLGEDQASGAGADDDDAEQRGVPKLAAGGKMRLRKIGDRQQDDSRDGVAQTHQHLRRHGFERDADAEVSGAPEEADRGQRQVGLKMRMARQNSG